MSVKKIRKISSWTMIVTIAISIVVLALFFFGGVVDPSATHIEPNYTGLLLQWTYILFAVIVVATILFSIWSFINNFRNNRKAALTSLLSVVLLAILLIVTFVMGDDTPLKVLNADSQVFNTPDWLKLADMWLHSIYVLMILCILAIVWGAVRKLIKK